MKTGEKRDLEYVSILIVGAFLIYLLLGGTNYLASISIPVIAEFQVNTDSDLEKIGLTTIFVYEFIPEGFRFVGISGFYFALIDQHVNDLLLLIIPAIGKVIGELILFVVGILVFKKFKSKNKLIVEAGKAIHKHKIAAFFLVPFGGMLGAFIMIVAGHEKVNFLKILPILVVANLIDVALWLYPTMAQLQVSSMLG